MRADKRQSPRMGRAPRQLASDRNTLPLLKRGWQRSGPALQAGWGTWRHKAWTCLLLKTLPYTAQSENRGGSHRFLRRVEKFETIISIISDGRERWPEEYVRWLGRGWGILKDRWPSTCVCSSPPAPSSPSHKAGLMTTNISFTSVIQ